MSSELMAGDPAVDHEQPVAGDPGRTPGRSWWWVGPVLAPFVVFFKALVGRQLLAPGDGLSVFLPLHVVAARIWSAGEVPGWNPFAFSGSPLLALSQAAVFYPPNLVFVLLPLVAANNVTVVLSFVVAGSGAYALTRHLCQDAAGAAVAGLAFAFSGFMFGHIGHQNMIASAAWLPWVIFGYELLRARTSPLRILVAGGALAMLALAGHPQILLISLLALGIYSAALTIGEGRSGRGRPIGVLLVVVGAGLALGAIQILPTAAILPFTDRSTLTYEVATSYSFPLTHLPLLVFPYLFGNNVPVAPFSAGYQGAWNLTELAGYAGTATLCLAAGGWTMWRRDRRALALLVSAAGCLVIALGSSTPVGRLVFELPVYGQLRSWGRYVLVVDLVVAVLAGFGVAALRRGSREDRRRAARGAGLVLAGVAAAALLIPLVSRLDPFVVDGNTRVLALGLPVLFAAAAWGLSALSIRSTRLMGVLACTVVVADLLLSFGAFYEWRAAGLPPARSEAVLSPERIPSWGRVPDLPGGVDRFLVASPDPGPVAPYLNVTSAKMLRSANGYDPLAPRSYLDAVGGMTYLGQITEPGDLWRPGSDILDLLRVSLLLVPDRSPAPPSDFAGGPAQAASTPGVSRYEYQPAVPSAFLVGKVEESTLEEAVAAVRGTRDFDPASTALVDEPCEQCSSMDRPGQAGSVVVQRHDSGRIKVQVDASAPAMLVVSEAWFPGWTAMVDGESRPVHRVDGLVLGVPVSSGEGVVELVYRPPGFRVGAIVTALSIGGLLISHAIWKRRLPSSSSPEPDARERDGP